MVDALRKGGEPDRDAILERLARECDGSQTSRERLGKALVEAGRLPQAALVLERLVAELPTSGGGRIVLANAYILDLEFDRAVPHLAVALGPDQPPAVREVARRMLASIQAGNAGAERVSALLEQRSATLMDQCRSRNADVVRTAFEGLDRLRRQFPRSIIVKAHRAIALAAASRKAEALVDIDELVVAAEGNADFHWNLGELLAICERQGEATEQYRKARALTQDVARRTEIMMRIASLAPCTPTVAATSSEPCAKSEADAPRPDAAPGAEWGAGQTVFDEFVVERKLGQGRMGQVHVVSDKTGARFAVKHTIRADERARRSLLEELQTLSDLPSYPHLAPMRFFRTQGAEIGVFCDVAESGSLEDAIRGRVLDGEAALDIAIQVAWGLAAVHDWTVVHADVKPSHMLIARDGTAMVSDFGASQTLVGPLESVFGVETDQPATSQGTLALQSPEQARGEQLTPATDVWSFGVSLLNVIRGDVTWATGVTADQVLDELLANPATSWLPLAPALEQTLRLCFRADPKQRPSMAAVATRLVEAFERVAGRAYTRAKPPVPDYVAAPEPHSRPARTPAKDRSDWRPPESWLAELGATRSATNAALRLIVGFIAKRGAFAQSFDGFDQAAKECERQIAAGRVDRQITLGRILHDRGVLQKRSGDPSGALVSFQSAERAFALADRSFDAIRGIGRAGAAQGSLLGAMGDMDSAARVYDRAIPLLHEVLAAQPGDEPARIDLACALGSRASVYNVKRDAPRACATVDEMRGVFPLETAPPDVLLTLVVALAIPLNARVAARDAAGAAAVAEEIIHLTERAVFDDGAVDAESVSKLLQAYEAKMLVHRKFQQATEAFHCLVRQVEAMVRLVNAHGQFQLLSQLEDLSTRTVEGCLLFRDRPGAVRLATLVVGRLTAVDNVAARSAADRLAARFRQMAVL